MRTISRCMPALAALGLIMLSGTAAPAPVASEYQLKAVFLFNFTQFVSWPPQTFADAQTPFVIGVLGTDPFGAALDDAVRGETVNGRPLVVQRYRSLADLKPCQILFIDRSAVAELARATRTIDRPGMLTVSDVGESAPDGVIIGFINENRKIRLRINVESARNAGLAISSNLLRPAQRIGTSEGG